MEVCDGLSETCLVLGTKLSCLVYETLPKWTKDQVVGDYGLL